MGQIENFYAPKNPTRGALCLAHFKPNEPYFLERSLTPLLDLQRRIFPWIESVCDNDMSDKTASWRSECDKEMLGVDPNIATDQDFFWIQPEKTTSTKQLSHAFIVAVLVTQFGFLKLLVRLRRIIHQEAVLFLRFNDNGLSLTNPLLWYLPDIFKSRMFVDFQHNLQDSIDAHHTCVSLFPNEAPVNVRTIITAINTFTDNSGATSRRIDR